MEPNLPPDSELPSKAKILQQAIPWDGYQRADLLTADQYALIQRFDKRPESDRLAVINGEGKALAQLFLALLQNINNPGTLQYVLSMLDDVFNAVPNFVHELLALGASSGHHHKHQEHIPYQPFLKLLSHKEPEFGFIKLHAAKVLCRFFRAHDNHARPEEVNHLVGWIMELLRERAPVDVRVGLAALAELLRSQDKRIQFHQSNGMNLLCQLLDRYSDSFQLQYETIMCMWLLSYNEEVADTLADTGVIKRVVTALKNSTKEKIIRICLATLANLANHGDNTESMIDHGIVRTLQSLNNKKWGDEDIISDLEKLTASVSTAMNNMSSWQRYTKELQSRNLEWSPVHKNERFWRENVEKFQDQSAACLKILHECLSSPSPLVKSVACFDLGEFARFHPQGKQVLQKMEIKIDIMKLMSDADPAVRKEALFAVQKTVPSMKFFA